MIDNSIAGTNSIGMFLSIDKLLFTTDTVPPLKPLLDYPAQLKTQVPILDTSNWVLIEVEYVAEGGEGYLTLGTFASSFDSLIIDTVNPIPSNPEVSYYFIDDVFVNICDDLPNLPYPIQLNPNPNNGQMTLNYTLPEHQTGKLRFYDMSGRLMFQWELHNWYGEFPIRENYFSNGLYIWEVESEGAILKRDKVQIIK